MTKVRNSSLLHSQKPPHLFLSQWNAEEARSEVLVQKPGSHFYFFPKTALPVCVEIPREVLNIL